MISYHLISITIALMIDRLIGDPPSWPHPVRWIGTFISWFERRLNKGVQIKAKGIILLIIVTITVILVTFLDVWGTYQLHSIAGVVAESVIIATTIAQNELKKASLNFYHPLK